MNHGDDVFVPLNVWPKHPSKTELVKDNLFTEIRLTKESTVLQDGCNITEGYAYGGNIILYVVCNIYVYKFRHFMKYIFLLYFLKFICKIVSGNNSSNSIDMRKMNCLRDAAFLG